MFFLYLHLCNTAYCSLSYLPIGFSGMTVMELGILSGFAVDKSSIEELDILKRVEDGPKALNLYFQQVTAILEIYLSNSSD